MRLLTRLYGISFLRGHNFALIFEPLPCWLLRAGETPDLASYLSLCMSGCLAYVMLMIMHSCDYSRSYTLGLVLIASISCVRN